jgi:hypothetical protein
MAIQLLRELHDFLWLLFRPKPRPGSAHAQIENDGQEVSTEVLLDQSIKASGSQPFEVHTYIGSDIAQMQEEERPAESAELVASVWLGGNDYRTYLLETNKKGSGGGESGWTLWQMGDDYGTGRPFCCRIAFAYPYSGCAAAFVAEQLLTRALEDERGLYGMFHTERDGEAVEAEGLMSAQDVRRIFTAVFA